MIIPPVWAFDLSIESEGLKKEWLDQLFYVGNKSLISSKNYFISENGGSDPVEELRASLSLIKKNATFFACKFPSRYAYLVRKTGLKDEVSCPEFDSWMDSFEANGLSIMFASQYLENPASSFGHTYLKINSLNKSLFLNRVISFAATVPEDVGAVDYIWRGLTGGFHGNFSESPFYILYQEYANMEKRDLWEYELTVSEKETRAILTKLYELIHLAEFEYLFTSQNCSSLLLKLIDIETQKNLIPDFPIYVLPIETVKSLQTKGMIRSSTFHPSITTRMSVMAGKMDAQEVEEVVKYVDQGKKLKSASSDALDLSLEYLNFKRQKNGGQLSGTEKKDFGDYLIMRSRYPEKPQQEKYTALNPLKSSHAQRLSLGMNSENQNSINPIISYRPLGKDFFDRPNGYAKESEINVLKTKVTLNRKEPRLSRAEVDLIGIKKYAAYDRLTKNFSWGFNLAIRNGENESCKTCYYSELDTFYGLGTSLFKDTILAYAVIHPAFKIGNLEDHMSFYPHAEMGVISSHESYVLKSSLLRGFIYGGHEWMNFYNILSIFSWILNDDYSLNLRHNYYSGIKDWNSLDATISYYF